MCVVQQTRYLSASPVTQTWEAARQPSHITSGRERARTERVVRNGERGREREVETEMARESERERIERVGREREGGGCELRQKLCWQYYIR